MQSATIYLCRSALCAVALTSWVYGAPTASANDDAAHALAQKFSQAADEGARADEARKAEARAKAEAKKQAEAARRKAAAAQRTTDEAEMLRSAKEEADTRRAADQARTEAEIRREAEQTRIEAERQAARAQAARLAEEARQQRLAQERQAEEQRKAEATRLTREVEEKRAAEEKHLAEERRIASEKAEAARLAEEKRKSEEARVAEIKRQAEAAEEKRKAEEARVADLKRQAEEADAKRRAEEDRLAEQRRIAEAKSAEQRAALEAQREAEAQRVAEKFKLAREARERSKETRSSLGGPAAVSAEPSPFIEAQAPVRTAYPQRVTVLVVMRPRPHGFAGARMTANPVLCTDDDCYVSNGAGSQASLMRRGQALGPGNTLGRNAGACRNHTACVFRGVTLRTALSTIQPVDMGFLHHDRREIRTVEPDRTCESVAGQLYCAAPIETEGYRAWIVPETVAVTAGAGALEHALDAGLPSARSAGGGSWKAELQAAPTR